MLPDENLFLRGLVAVRGHEIAKLSKKIHHQRLLIKQLKFKLDGLEPIHELELGLLQVMSDQNMLLTRRVQELKKALVEAGDNRGRP